jgi:CRP-like cAMP-binding protein
MVEVGEVEAQPRVDTEWRLRALSELFLFRDLTFQELLQTTKVVREHRCERGEVLFREGEPGDRLFVVLDGSLKVTKGDVELATLSAHDHFGELSVLDARPRSASVTALEPSLLLYIQRDELRTLLDRNHSLANKLLWRFSLGLSERLRSMTEDFVVQKRR